jgi:small conductance mechanosensitive channel
MQKGKKKLVKIIVCLVAIALLSGISVWTGVVDGVEDLAAVARLSWNSIVKVVIMSCFVLIFESLIQLILEAIKTENRKVKTVTTILSSFLKYIAVIVIICWGFVILGVNVGAVLLSAGILTASIGFGAESLFVDVITGVFMLFENQYSVGDIIEVDGFRGTVRTIGIRTTTIADAGENFKIINNSEMKNILNRSQQVSVAVCDIGISYEADLETVENELKAYLDTLFEKHPDEMKEAPKYLGVQELGDSAVVLRFTARVDENKLFSTQRMLNRELYLKVKSMGVEVPYMQIDVHTK